VCIAYQRDGGEHVLPSDNGVHKLSSGTKYQMIAWFQPSPPKQGTSDKISIEGGTDARNVEFSLKADGEKGTFRPRQTPVLFSVTERSPEVKFDFNSPKESGAFECWVE